MRYFIDTEFHEYKVKPLFGKSIDTIDLISIGIVSEDGREYYAVCNEFDVKAAWNNEWLRENVLKSIWIELNQQMGTYHKTYHYSTTNQFCLKHLKRLLKWVGKTKKEIADEVLVFCSNGYFNEGNSGMPFSEKMKHKLKGIFKPEFYAYYADYDWVVFCWLFGRMIDLPNFFPMYCRDLKQMMDEKGLDKHWKRKNCPDPEGEHNALVDAKWNLELYNKVSSL